MGAFIDLTGQKFHRWTVISRNIEAQRKFGSTGAYWNCVCECGTERVIIGGNLRRGISKSCGCYNKECSAKLGKKNKKSNRFDISSDEYGIGYTTNNEKFIFDKEDFEKIKGICWHLQKGYVVGLIKGKKVNMHKYILNYEEGGLVVDHINGDKTDNRKMNLRICSQHHNSMNRKLNKNNQSGHKGVSFNARNGKWIARIKYNYKNICLGSFEKIEDAIAARENAEKIYFGKYSKIARGSI